MQGVFLRKYGVETTIDFQLYSTLGTELKTDAVHAAGDSKIMKDEGAEANTTNGFVDEGQGCSVTLTATEMQAARIIVYIIDQTSPKAWIDSALVIDTYGHASAQHAFDLSVATVKLAADGLDSLPTTEPAGVASTVREMLVQTWRKAFKKSVLTKLTGTTGTLETHKDNDSVCTTQAITEEGGVQTVEDAA